MTVAVLAVLGQAVVIAHVDPGQLATGLGGLWRLVLDGLPPDPSVLPNAAGAVLQTVDIALVATVAATLISVPLAAAGASTLAVGRYLAGPVRAAAAFLRSIPDLVWALVFVAAVGLGPFAGVLALTVHSVGMLVRLFAEAIEEMDAGPVDVLVTSGATRMQVFSHAVLPELLPTFGSLALYRLEQNVRASLVLGFVGAGGIGFQVLSAMEEFQYQQASMLLLVLFVLVILVEMLSGKLRALTR
ncbi:phosphonate ABC transporter, permease protein PhnE [Pseudonocardia spinosispora]|uniref:phosphonate ABC transporter, permease protein PhnE n=1 Tax=Pseudonocardia spinosispora TaxID=103441 RepID=UPI00146FB5C4|nr:phosphonate ABC transporter, permease protein PhnE [Pseudonocardia spinosispora]